MIASNIALLDQQWLLLNQNFCDIYNLVIGTVTMNYRAMAVIYQTIKTAYWIITNITALVPYILLEPHLEHSCS